MFAASYERVNPQPLPQPIFSRLNVRGLQEAARHVEWSHFDEFSNAEDLEVFFRATYFDLVSDHIPFRSTKKMNKPPWFKKRHSRLIAKKRSAYRLFKRHPTNANKVKLNKAKNSLKRDVRASREKCEERLASFAHSNPKMIFKHIRQCRDLRSQISSIIREVGGSTDDSSEQSELFRQFFSSVFTRDNGYHPPFRLPQPERIMRPVLFTEDEVRMQLKRLDPNKGAGPDGIHPRVRRELADFITRPLTLSSTFRYSVELSLLCGKQPFSDQSLKRETRMIIALSA